MSLLPWPFRRKQYNGLGNPRFVSDIVAANEAIIDAMTAITGLGSVDFAIITGLDYTPGTPNGSYGPGIFYLDGQFYYFGASFTEGLYLTPNLVDTMPKPFSDGNGRNIYTLLSALSTSSPAGATPVFSSNMDQYRIGLKNVKNNIVSMQATLALLGNSAFRNVGTTAGTVAAGDDSRFGYTQGQIDTLFAKKADVILKGAGIAYTPTASTDPVNKQYADAASGAKMVWAGEITAIAGVNKWSGPLTVTAVRIGVGHYQLTHNLGSNNFFLSGFGLDTGSRLCSPRSYEYGVAGVFDVYVSDDGSANDAAFQLTMWQYY